MKVLHGIVGKKKKREAVPTPDLCFPLCVIPSILHSIQAQLNLRFFHLCYCLGKFPSVILAVIKCSSIGYPEFAYTVVHQFKACLSEFGADLLHGAAAPAVGAEGNFVIFMI